MIVWFLFLTEKIHSIYITFGVKGSCYKLKIKLVSPIPCSVNHYIKARPFIFKGKAQVTMYETAEAKKYKKNFKKYVESEMERQNIHIIPNKTQHYYCDCVFYFERIDQDANNYFKLLLDAITDSGRIWVDDNVVCERVNGIYYDSKNPRIELEIYPVDYIGIFKNKKEFEEFETGCLECSRYRNGRCSILIKAQNGRIQDDIVGLQCQKQNIRRDK